MVPLTEEVHDSIIVERVVKGELVEALEGFGQLLQVDVAVEADVSRAGPGLGFVQELGSGRGRGRQRRGAGGPRRAGSYLGSGRVSGRYGRGWWVPVPVPSDRGDGVGGRHLPHRPAPPRS